MYPRGQTPRVNTLTTRLDHQFTNQIPLCASLTRVERQVPAVRCTRNLWIHTRNTFLPFICTQRPSFKNARRASADTLKTCPVRVKRAETLGKVKHKRSVRSKTPPDESPPTRVHASGICVPYRAWPDIAKRGNQYTQLGCSDGAPIKPGRLVGKPEVSQDVQKQGSLVDD